MKSLWLRGLITLLLCWSFVLPAFAQNRGEQPVVPPGQPAPAESTDPCAQLNIQIPSDVNLEASEDQVVVILTESIRSNGLALSCGRVVECIRNEIAGAKKEDGTRKYDSATARRLENYLLQTNYQACIVSGRDGLDLLNNYASMVYGWIAGIVGSICILIIVVSGIQISLGGLSPDEVGSAKERVSRSLVGLAVLFLSAFILYSINPTFFS